MPIARYVVIAAALLFLPAVAFATADFVQHDPGTAVYGEPSGTTMREEEVPREDEVVTLWARVGYSFWYTDVAIYYTTDGTEPLGSQGIGSGTTSVLRSATGEVSFVRNEPGSTASIDWWRAALPASTRAYGLTIKYKIGAWHSSGGAEVFANSTGCADGTCDDPSAPAAVFSYPVRLAWPGRGHPDTNPGVGYPNTHFWKEEAVVGNNYINVQLDLNGSVYDIYYPGAGCVQGVGTKNEGYVDGNDTFPPGLPLGNRGQMHMNMGAAGLRVDGVTYWLTNEGGAYTGVSQSYVTDTNVVRTSQTLVTSGASIRVERYDFCPKGITFPSSSGGDPVRGLYLKRVLLTNNGSSAKTVNFYYFADHALNGGDSYDVMSFDQSRGAMVATDSTYRSTSTSGEYNPTSFSSYTKNVSLSLASALKLCGSVGGSTGSPAVDSWRDSSGDNDQGWIGLKLTLEPGQSKEVDLAMVGGFKPEAGDPGTAGIYDGQIAPALQWFYATSVANLQSSTESYWRDWLSSGTTIDLPGELYDALFKRSLLATALHIDEKGGGVIAGMHNGAYPFVWPRDAVYAAITLDRTGHTTEAENVYRFLRDVAYRATEEPGRKGFWYQKYSTDGYMVWTAPQVDETAAVPWGARFHFDTTGDSSFLTQNYQMVYEAARASSEDSVTDSRLYYDDSYNLMHSNNVWEDSWDDFIYSNAAVERGLRDASALASASGHTQDAATFASRADAISGGIGARLTWDGENTDISLLGPSYPFEVIPADDARMQHVLARINGTETDRSGNTHPLTNSSGEFSGLVNRYWGDTYWNGGPWFLSTLWYGQFCARLQQSQAPGSLASLLRSKIDLVIGRLGPCGLGAEQMAPSSSLLYPGESGFSLQAAWPNAWESMSTIVDSLMLFFDFKPDASHGRFSIAPQFPSGWSSMSANNLRVGDVRFSVNCAQLANEGRQTFTNITGGALCVDTVIRIPSGKTPSSVSRGGVAVPYTFKSSTAQVVISSRLDSGAGSTTVFSVFFADGPTLSVPELKRQPVGTMAYLDDVIVTRVHADRFNVEPVDRTSGIAVLGSGPGKGQRVKLYGAVRDSGPERVLGLTTVVERSDAPVVPGPLAMAGRSVGAYAPDLVGLDVTLFGVVREIWYNGWSIVIDDGSGLVSASGAAGIRVTGNLDMWSFAVGQYVCATGSMSVMSSGGICYPLLRVAAPEDVR